jgi:hypothetical protein
MPERRKALIQRAESAGIDWKGPLANILNDERARVAALATLLGMDAHLALNPEVNLDEIVELAMHADETRAGMRDLPARSGPGAGD